MWSLLLIHHQKLPKCAKRHSTPKHSWWANQTNCLQTSGDVAEFSQRTRWQGAWAIRSSTRQPRNERRSWACQKFYLRKSIIQCLLIDGDYPAHKLCLTVIIPPQGVWYLLKHPRDGCWWPATLASTTNTFVQKSANICRELMSLLKAWMCGVCVESSHCRHFALFQTDKEREQRKWKHIQKMFSNASDKRRKQVPPKAIRETRKHNTSSKSKFWWQQSLFLQDALSDKNLPKDQFNDLCSNCCHQNQEDIYIHVVHHWKLSDQMDQSQVAVKKDQRNKK